MNNISAKAITAAINQIIRHGDTDIFPPLPEIAFLKDCAVEIADVLSKLNTANYTPKTAITSLAPKGRLGFRSAHQLSLTDNLFLLAAVVEIGPHIESLRLPPAEISAFSYRFDVSKDGEIFAKGRSYRDWLFAQKDFLEKNPSVKYVLKTDISDFYHRIYAHRLEGFFGDWPKATATATSLVVRIIKAIRGKESFGLPVGGAASRLLAELSLRDSDKALFNDGVPFTRFVDDYRFFIKNDEAYDVLAFLAENLLAEGLTLNSAKTKLIEKEKYLEEITDGTADLFDASEEAAIEALTASLYIEDEPDPNEVAALQGLNLVGILEALVEEDEPDFGKIKKVLKAIRVANPEKSVDAILEHFAQLVPMMKELVLILEEVVKSDKTADLTKLREAFKSAYAVPPARNIAILRAWLIEAFLRGIFSFGSSDLKAFGDLSTQLDLRQNYLLQGKLDNRTFFRNKKYQFDSISNSERFSFLIGATCLPKEEFDVFVGAIKGKLDDPLADIFLKWLKDKHGALL
jgi:hypothetical protein